MLIADDDALARLGLRTLLRPVSEIEVIAETGDATALDDLVAALAPDVVAVDDRFGSGAGSGRRRAGTDRALAIMATGMHGDRRTPEPVIVPKAAPLTDLVVAISLAAGRPELWAVRPTGLDDLTPREAEVLGLVARGLTNEEIRLQLGLSLETVRTHLKHIYAKCGVADRSQAVIAAYRGGLASP